MGVTLVEDSILFDRPFNCMDTFTHCIFLLNLGTQYLRKFLIWGKFSINFQTFDKVFFGSASKMHDYIRHKRNTDMILSDIHVYTACRPANLETFQILYEVKRRGHGEHATERPV
jgi:hypothetical protein